jgi:hypothetical protein
MPSVRAVVVARAHSTVPAADLPALIDAVVDWQERYADDDQECAFFAGYPEGCSIVEAPNEDMLFRMIAEWPLSLYSRVDVIRLPDWPIDTIGLPDELAA